MTHARRQQYRHLIRSAGYALAGAAILPVALSGSLNGGGAMALTLLLLVGDLWLAARRSKRRAGRWRVGADSEQAVRLVLNELSRSGWVVRNGVRWPGGGDVDHLVRSPDGLGFAIETINEALCALPAHWIRVAGVYLPELGSPLRYLAIGPTGAFILTPTNGCWTRDGLLELERGARAVDRFLPVHDFSPTRIRFVLAPNHPTLRAQVLGIPGTRRIWLIEADELYAHLLTHAGAGPCPGDLNRMHRALMAKLPANGCGLRPWPAVGGLDAPDVGRPPFDD